jgi:hypothetical protein
LKAAAARYQESEGRKKSQESGLDKGKHTAKELKGSPLLDNPVASLSRREAIVMGEMDINFTWKK